MDNENSDPIARETDKKLNELAALNKRQEDANQSEGSDTPPSNPDDDPEAYLKYIRRRISVWWGRVKARFGWVTSNRTIAGFTVVIALTGIVYAMSSWMQWRVMSGQLREMHDANELTRKQMEGISAARVEISNGIQMSLAVPPFGFISATPINKGHVNSPEATLTVSLSLKDSHQNTQRVIFSNKTDKRTVIPPGDASGLPDFRFQFELSADEYRQVQKTEAYLVVDSTFDYDNGFGKNVTQSACTAYLWGSDKFGRATVSCDEVQTQLDLAKKLAVGQSKRN